MRRLRDVAEQAQKIADATTGDLTSLAGHVRNSVDAARCAEICEKLRAQIEKIDWYRGVSDSGDDEAVIE